MRGLRRLFPFSSRVGARGFQALHGERGRRVGIFGLCGPGFVRGVETVGGRARIGYGLHGIVHRGHEDLERLGLRLWLSFLPWYWHCASIVRAVMGVKVHNRLPLHRPFLLANWPFRFPRLVWSLQWMSLPFQAS